MRFSIGIEGTFAPHCEDDTLTITGHFDRDQWRHDLALVRELGLDEMRYPIPWHSVERERGRYRWDQLDAILAHAEAIGVGVIADMLHHTSYPAWLHGGFLNPAIVTSFPDFVDAFAERYPAVTTYTPFNEPTCTLDFSGLRGWWHPYGNSAGAYVTMLRHTACATAKAVHRLRRRNPAIRILHVDTFERHAALDAASQPQAAFLNERRFLFEELVSGAVDDAHPLASYLLRNGFTEAELAWHRLHPIRIDERGGNYYPLNEEQLLDGRTFRAPSSAPLGLARTVHDYAARLPYPLSLTETNIQGTVRDRISWLKYVLEQTERLAADGIVLQQFAWYPLFDCAGWRCLLQGSASEWPRDPQGIYSCNDDWRRVPTELSEIYGAVARGAVAGDLPAYAFGPEHAATLGALQPQMDWRWQAQ